MIALYIIGALFLIWLAQLIWYIHPYKALNWLCHDIMGWHKPDNTHSFDGLSEHSHCRFCGKEIMQDSQGNWFTYYQEKPNCQPCIDIYGPDVASECKRCMELHRYEVEKFYS